MKDLKKKSLTFFKKTSAVIFIILIVAGFFWKVFLLNEVPIPGDFITGVYFPWLDYKWGYSVGVPVKNPITADVVSYSYPMRMLGINLLKSGQLPLWNPYILMGTPLLANFQSAPFSLTTIYYYLLDNYSAWSMQIITQHVFAALFTYLLLRHWKISKTGSVLGGIVYAFSGFNLIWSEWNAHALAASFIPLLIYLEDNWLESGKIKFGIVLAITIFLQILSGYPQIVFYTFITLGLLWLVRIKQTKFLIFKTILLGVFIALGIGLSSFQILPGLELLNSSQRVAEAHPFDWAFLPWQKVITFIAPDFFGNHSTGNYWGPQDYTSNTGFVGVVAFLLVFIPLKNIFKKRNLFFCYLILTISLLLSFPTPLSIMFWKSGIFGLNAAAAHRALVIFNLSVALLSGFGLDLVYSNKTLSRFAIFLPLSLLFIFGVYSFGIHQYVGLKNLIIPSILLITTIGAIYIRLKYLIIVLSVLELFFFGWKFTPFSPRRLIYPETPIISFLKNAKGPVRTTGDHVIPINFRMAYGIESVEGYDAIYPFATSKFVNEVNNAGQDAQFRRYAIVDNDTSPLLDKANTKYYLALKNDKDLKRFDSKRFRIAFEDKSVIIFESKTVLPRAYFTQSFGTAKYKTYRETSSVINVNTANNDNLVISDVWYPGWKAFVDGKEVQLNRYNEIFRSINVPKGTHEIKMVYQPESFRKGVLLSSASLIILILIGSCWFVGNKFLPRYT